VRDGSEMVTGAGRGLGRAYRPGSGEAGADVASIPDVNERRAVSVAEAVA